MPKNPQMERSEGPLLGPGMTQALGRARTFSSW